MPSSVEVVVTLKAPALADARFRELAGGVGHPVSVDSAASASYIRGLEVAQQTVAKRIEHAIPGSSVRWHYAVVLDGMAVVVPRGKTGELALRLPEEERDSFLKKYETKLCELYGVVQKEYVMVPESLLRNTNELKPYFDASAS